jgi:predicted AAA+ superfamily ATPase
MEVQPVSSPSSLPVYLPRFVDRLLDELLAELPAVMITGPCGCGKTTTALRHAKSVVRLDDPRQASAFAAAPDAALAAAEPPVLLDEWQEVPEVLGAVKRAVDVTAGPGRYLLTGSVRGRMSGEVWAGTGRVTPVSMFGLTVAETRASADSARFLDRLFEPSALPAAIVRDAPDVPGYLDLALRSGFPAVLSLGARARGVWLDGYVDQLIHRDARSVAAVRSPERLMACLRAVAACLAGTPTNTTLAEAAGVDVRTARSYLDLLEDLRVIERLPPWHSNRLTRLVKSPKLHLIDPALAATVLGVDARGVLLDGHVLGQILESFVVAQLRPLLSLGATPITMAHLRDRGGDHEIDIVLENRRGDVVAVEVKAAPKADRRDVGHLEWLRDRIGHRFVRGVVMTTGNVGAELGDRIQSLPIAAIWTPEALLAA